MTTKGRDGMLTVVFEGISINTETVRKAIGSSHLFTATHIAVKMGYRQVDSNHGAYRPVLRALNKLYEDGEIGKYYIPAVNASVFYRIP